MNEIQEHYIRRALGKIHELEADYTNRVVMGVPKAIEEYRENVGYIKALRAVKEFIIEDQKPKEDKR